MLEVGGRSERIDDRIRKFFSEDAFEAFAKLLAGDAFGAASVIAANEFEAAWFGFAEALDFENDGIPAGFFDAQQAAGEIAFVGPQMNQDFFVFLMNFPLEAGELGEPLAVFANFDHAGGGEFAESAFEIRPIVGLGV